MHLSHLLHLILCQTTRQTTRHLDALDEASRQLPSRPAGVAGLESALCKPVGQGWTFGHGRRGLRGESSVREWSNPPVAEVAILSGNGCR